jgi:hypothetical protein
MADIYLFSNRAIVKYRSRRYRMRPPKGVFFLILSLALFAAMLFTLWAMERGKLKSRHGAYGMSVDLDEGVGPLAGSHPLGVGQLYSPVGVGVDAEELVLAGGVTRLEGAVDKPVAAVDEVRRGLVDGDRVG